VRGVFLGLGSNLGDRAANIDQGLARLAEHPRIVVRRVSPLYETAPVGPVGPGDFLNGAAEIETQLEPEPLLGILLATEKLLGRVRTGRPGPRTLDLDLLLYGPEIIDRPGLVVPHPRLHERRFVLAPLADIAPEAIVPDRGRTVRQLYAALPDDGGVTRMER
jgi:2-amino-4-hydroxy-6-hydroxymethyldihydropteridine diphosphokinase